MRKWLSRFSFTLLILGGLLFYQAYLMQTGQPPAPSWQILILVIGGAAMISLGASGIRYRHAMIHRDEP